MLPSYLTLMEESKKKNKKSSDNTCLFSNQQAGSGRYLEEVVMSMLDHKNDIFNR
jgi:hypothetical protein